MIVESDAEVYEDLRRMLLWDTFPCITEADVNWIFARIKRPDLFRNPPDQHRFWEASVEKRAGDTVVPDPRPFTYADGIYTLQPVSYFTCVVGGGTDLITQPDWTTAVNAGDTVTDNEVTWSLTAQAPWTPTWDLAWGLMRGWKLKAANVVTQYDIQNAGHSMKRSQLMEHCLTIANEWGKVVAGNWRQVKLTGSLRARMNIFPISNRSDDVDIVDAFLQRYGDYPGTGWAIPGQVHYQDW